MNLIHITCNGCNFEWVGPAFKDFIVCNGKLIRLGFRVGVAVNKADALKFIPKLCTGCGEVTFIYEEAPKCEKLLEINIAENDRVSSNQSCSVCGNTTLWRIEVGGLFSRLQNCPKCEQGKLRVARDILK